MSELQLLSNGSYHLMVTASGHATSFCEGLAVTRWCADASLDSSGSRCYVRGDAAPGSSSIGTSGHDFHDGRASVWAHDETLETRSEFAVSIDQPVEVRRVVLPTFPQGV